MFKFKTDHLPEWRQKEIIEGGYWILPSHRTPQRKMEAQTVLKYWTVTITLTSGKVKQFYIKAKTLQDALEKAKGYSYLDNITLNGEWSLLP